MDFFLKFDTFVSFLKSTEFVIRICTLVLSDGLLCGGSKKKKQKTSALETDSFSCLGGFEWNKNSLQCFYLGKGEIWIWTLILKLHSLRPEPSAGQAPRAPKPSALVCFRTRRARFKQTAVGLRYTLGIRIRDHLEADSKKKNNFIQRENTGRHSKTFKCFFSVIPTITSQKTVRDNTSDPRNYTNVTNTEPLGHSDVCDWF